MLRARDERNSLSLDTLVVLLTRKNNTDMPAKVTEFASNVHGLHPFFVLGVQGFTSHVRTYLNRPSSQREHSPNDTSHEDPFGR